MAKQGAASCSCQLYWEMTVIVGLRISKGRMMDVQKRIARDERVYAIYDVTGDFSIGLGLLTLVSIFLLALLVLLKKHAGLS